MMKRTTAGLKNRLFLLRVVGAPLVPICVYWWVEAWVRRQLGMTVRDNCFTWAVRHYDYAGGDGICFHRSRSSWFPHVVILKGMREEHRMTVTILEYVPMCRIDGIASPPRKFSGYVKRTRLVEL